MRKSQQRFNEGRQARLTKEVNAKQTNEAVEFSCIYRRPEQINDFKRGWNSVSLVDINMALRSQL